MSDLIDRKSAIEAIDSVLVEDESCKVWFRLALQNLPSAQPKREKGTWTNDAGCPFCGFQPWYERDIHTLSFCPNCGADMRGKQDE